MMSKSSQLHLCFNGEINCNQASLLVVSMKIGGRFSIEVQDSAKGFLEAFV